MGVRARRARRRTRAALATAVAAALLLWWPAGPLRGHEEAVLESSASAVPAGGALDLQGRDFAAGESYALRLLGALREYDLGEVEPAADGTFSLRLAIPGDVVPGSYQLVAVAPDGDVSARLDLVILDAAAAGDAHAAHGAPGRPVARDDDIRIDRSRSGAEWGVLGLLIGLAAGLGIGLFRTPGAGV